MNMRTGPPAAGLPAVREAIWENEGGAICPPAHVATAALVRARQDRPATGRGFEQPRLYADLLAEADRLRRAAGECRAPGLIAGCDRPS